MLNFCKQLPEYETVMAMYGVGKSTGPHLMAELGDVRRFLHRSSIVAFAGVDPGVVGSGKMQLSSVATSKRGSPQLRKALFQVVSTYVKCKPEMKQFTSSTLRNVTRESRSSFALPLPRTNSCAFTMLALRSA